MEHQAPQGKLANASQLLWPSKETAKALQSELLDLQKQATEAAACKTKAKEEAQEQVQCCPSWVALGAGGGA